MQGASAIEKLLDEQHDSRIRVFVIWEPVLATDLGAPSTATLRRASDLRVSQYWDKEHIVSRLLGERDRASVVWDHVAVYQPGKLWDQAPPDPVYSRVPVIRGIDGAKDAVRQLLRGPDCWVKKGFHWDEAILYAPCEHWKDAQTAFWNSPVFRIAPALEKSLSEQH